MPTIDLDDLDAFFDGRPAARPADTSPRGLAGYREEILEWLVGAGMSQRGLEPGLCHEALAGRAATRLFVFLEDASPAQAAVVPVAESALSPAQRQAFDALGSACFEPRIEADLRPAQYAGGLLALSWYYGVAADSIRHMARQLGLERLELVDVYTPGLTDADLNAPIVACHTLRLAM